MGGKQTLRECLQVLGSGLREVEQHYGDRLASVPTPPRGHLTLQDCHGLLEFEPVHHFPVLILNFETRPEVEAASFDIVT